MVQALVNGLENDRLHHAFLFTGTRGVGKTTLARVFAKSLNCLEGVSGSPCDKCNHCQEIKNGDFIDLIEVDAASRTGVDDTRALLDNVQYAPSKGRYKIYLIDEVHMFSKSSFNALLKTLEEPPPHVKFLLATTEPDKLPITVLSRCLQFNLKRLTQKQIADHLQFLLQQEELEFDDKAIALIARVADGSMRDALSLLDQSLAFGAGKLDYNEVRNMLGTVEHSHVTELLTLVDQEDHDAVLQKLQWLHEMSVDYEQVLEELCLLLHEVSLIQQFERVIGSANFELAELRKLSAQISAEKLQLYYQLVMLALQQIHFAPNKKINFETAIIRMLAFEWQQPEQNSLKKNPEISVPKKPEKNQPTLAANPQTSFNDNASPTKKIVENNTKSSKTTENSSENQETAEEQWLLPLTDLTAQSWLKEFANLPLKGLSRELARNLELLKNDGNTLTFALDRRMSSFLNDASQKVFEQVLQVAEQGYQLEFELATAVNSAATIEQQQQQQLNQSQQQSFSENPLLNELQKQFAAEVIEVKDMT